MDLCGKSRGFADFENTVDGGSAVIFYADSGLCLLNEIWVTNLSSALIGMLMSSSNLNLGSPAKEVHLNSGVRLLLELYCVVVIKNIAFSHLNLYMFSDVVVVSELNKHFGGSTDMAKKEARIGGFAYPYSPPSGKREHM